VVRIYLPSTLALLREWIAGSAVLPRSGIGFAVTDTLREEYPGTEEEELEYLALTDAARASLRLLSAEPAGDDPALRVVIAADVVSATAYPQGDRAAVKLAEPVPWNDVAAVHIDGADAADVVRVAVDAVNAADLGDLDAEFAIGEAESRELAWYAPTEISYLIEELS